MMQQIAEEKRGGKRGDNLHHKHHRIARHDARVQLEGSSCPWAGMRMAGRPREFPVGTREVAETQGDAPGQQIWVVTERIQARGGVEFRIGLARRRRPESRRVLQPQLTQPGSDQRGTATSANATPPAMPRRLSIFALGTRRRSAAAPAFAPPAPETSTPPLVTPRSRDPPGGRRGAERRGARAVRRRVHPAPRTPRTSRPSREQAQ